MISFHRFLKFDEKRGGKAWRKAVADWEAARLSYARALLAPPEPRQPVPMTGKVVALADWRWNKACRLTPAEEAELRYKEASVRLISERSPDMHAHYAKTQLIAELLGVPDTYGEYSDRQAWREPLCAGILLRELGCDCFGLLKEAWLDDEPQAAHQPS